MDGWFKRRASGLEHQALSTSHTSRLPLPSMHDAGHVLRFRDGYYAFLLFIILSLPPATVASTSSLYSAATQCGPFTITWENTTSPLSLLILPFDTQPIISNLTNPLYDPVAATWNYTLDQLPLKSGVKFIVTLDFGYGAPFSSLTRYNSESSPRIRSFWLHFPQQVDLPEMYPWSKQWVTRLI